MLLLTLLLGAVVVFTVVAMVILAVLSLVLWLLRLAGKTTFRIARFGIKFIGLAVILGISMVISLIIGII